MIDFTTARPLKEAVDSISRRTPLGTALNSAELERLPLEVRDAAFFSAQVQSEKFLIDAQTRITQRIRLERSKLADGKPGVTMDRRRFIDEMRVELKKAGYRPDPKKKDSLQDLSSSGRLGLIWDMNLSQANGAARWKAGTTAAILRAEPAMEFIRLENRVERRLWNVKWKGLGGTFYPGPSEYPEGRMIALKTDPIWRALNRFGVPWRPFDWGSGMGTQGVRRREALRLGVIKEGDPAQTPEMLPLTAGLQASIKGLPQVSRDRLRSEMGDAIRFDKDTLIYQRDTTEANEHRDETIHDELRARARSYFERGAEALATIRSSNAGAEAFFGSPEADEFRQVFLAQLAAVGTGRKQLFHDSFPPAAAKALMDMVAAVMPQVETEFDEGHLIAWRPDLQELSPSELLRLSKEDPVAKNGILLGYGLESRQTSAAFDQVYLKGPDGRIWSGFHAAPRTSRIYAAARLRDLLDAIGAGFEAVIVNIPALTKGGAL